MGKKKRFFVIILLHLIFGVYLINYSLDIISMPGFIRSLDKLIILVSGVMVLFGGINYIRYSKTKGKFYNKKHKKIKKKNKEE